MKKHLKTIIVSIIIIATPIILTYIHHSIKYKNWDCRKWSFISAETQKQEEPK